MPLLTGPALDQVHVAQPVQVEYVLVMESKYPKRKQSVRHISTLIDHLVPPSITEKLTPFWVSVVGEELAGHSTAKIRGKVLAVQGADSLVVQRLNLMAVQLLEKAKAHPDGQSLESIKITLARGKGRKGGKTPRQSPGAGSSARPRNREGAPVVPRISPARLEQGDSMARALTLAVDDEELSQALRRYLTYALARSVEEGDEDQ